MKVKDFSGRECAWPRKKDCKDKELINKSTLHCQALSLLQELFPTQLILEEVYLPNSRLHLDFYLPIEKIAIEVQGSQHYKFSNHFYSNRLQFLKAQVRDKQKKVWCDENKIRLVELSFDCVDKWKNLIMDISKNNEIN